MNKGNIIGQSSLLKRLEIVVENGRIAHSYIFTGPPGIGKRTLSDYFVKVLLCQGANKPCHDCRACRQFDSGNHPDVMRVKPEKKTLGIDSIRAIREDIGVKPFQGPFKIYILEQGESMTIQAQNAFLKTLEEPPGHAHIIILTENLASLLPTIVSRCQIIKVPPLSPSEVAKILETRAGISREEAIVFGRLSEGIPGKGLELASSPEYRTLRDETLEIIEELSKGSLVEALGHMEYFQENRENIGEILDLMELWMRDILALKGGYDEDIIINRDKLSPLKAMADIFTFRDIQCIIDAIEDSKKKLISHANYQLTLESLLMKIQGSGEYAGSSRNTF